ncbi:hypothetical protein [Streptomyces sp. NPDC005281]|uniref:hypothetical protein n=1 Tax=Streptomyces sp. NPDC005281 TaxID=3155712 RepID=UPI0033A1D92B
MQICTRSLARVPRPGNPKGAAILLEFFRRNRQDFRKGWNYVFTPGRRRPQVRALPIVAPVMDGYGSRYPSARLDMGRPMVTCPLDLV